MAAVQSQSCLNVGEGQLIESAKPASSDACAPLQNNVGSPRNDARLCPPTLVTRETSTRTTARFQNIPPPIGSFPQPKGDRSSARAAAQSPQVRSALHANCAKAVPLDGQS